MNVSQYVSDFLDDIIISGLEAMVPEFYGVGVENIEIRPTVTSIMFVIPIGS